jgi:hypothetical protein
MRIGFNLGGKQYGRFTEINNRIERISKPIRSLNYTVMNNLRNTLTNFTLIASFYQKCKIVPVFTYIGGKNMETGLSRQYERIATRENILRALIPRFLSKQEKKFIMTLLTPDLFPEVVFGKGVLFRLSAKNCSRHDLEKELSIIDDPIKDLEETFKSRSEYKWIIELLGT